MRRSTQSTVNPLVPTALDVAFSLVTTVHIVLAVLALIGFARSRAKQGGLGTILLIVFVPIAGPIVSLYVHRKARKSVLPASPRRD